MNTEQLLAYERVVKVQTVLLPETANLDELEIALRFDEDGTCKVTPELSEFWVDKDTAALLSKLFAEIADAV